MNPTNTHNTNSDSKTEETWHKIQGAWEQVKGSIKETWGKLTDDDIAACKGNRDLMIGKIMQRQGIDRELAERQLAQWQRTTLC